MATNTGVAETIVETVAQKKDTDPVELNQRLGDVIDPDALNRLFDTPAEQPTSSSSAAVSFEYCGYFITVTEHERVIIHGRES